MKTSTKCVGCFFSQVEKTAEIIKISEKKKQAIYRVLGKELSQFDFDMPPVVFGRVIYKTISKITGNKDPFLKQKRKIERHLVSLYSEIAALIEKDSDPFYKAAKLCCAANAIDFGAGKTPDIKSIVKNLHKEKLTVDHFKEFKSKLRKASEVLFLGDNCGEIFFDKFFIE